MIIRHKLLRCDLLQLSVVCVKLVSVGDTPPFPLSWSPDESTVGSRDRRMKFDCEAEERPRRTKARRTGIDAAVMVVASSAMPRIFRSTVVAFHNC